MAIFSISGDTLSLVNSQAISFRGSGDAVSMDSSLAVTSQGYLLVTNGLAATTYNGFATCSRTNVSVVSLDASGAVVKVALVTMYEYETTIRGQGAQQSAGRGTACDACRSVGA